MKKLVIIGCGPKAIAIATKAYVLNKLGWEVPEIIIIEKFGPAANWDGTNGYTDGELILGTPPFEDVGYPYSSSIHQSVDEEMLKFSWFSYLITTGKYSEWINRNLQPPTHSMLADYFKWVVEKIAIPVIVGEATAFSLKEDKWEVTYKTAIGVKVATGDGLVITGPGDAYKFPISGNSKENKEKIFNGQDIWLNINFFKDMQHAKIAVIGGGETAAAVVTGLLEKVDNSSKIEIITRHGMLFTRNQNWMEVMYFSNALRWTSLSMNDRIEIIKRADRGTFSPGVKDLLDSVYNVSIKPGQVEKIEIVNGETYLVLSVNSKVQKVKYDYIVEATGFDPLSFTNLITDKSFLENHRLTPERIDTDLSVMGVVPKLHVPALAGLAQGPGFPNLTCLGLVSERILSSYIYHKNSKS